MTYVTSGRGSIGVKGIFLGICLSPPLSSVSFSGRLIVPGGKMSTRLTFSQHL